MRLAIDPVGMGHVGQKQYPHHYHQLGLCPRFLKVENH